MLGSIDPSNGVLMNTEAITRKPTTLKDERGQTDTSLVSERTKTDHSFSDHRKQSEIETTRKVQSARQGADQARDQSRRTADASSENGQADKHVVNQRERADEATKSERLIVDEFLVNERNANGKESTKFLERERKETDQNLSRERSHTDAEVLATQAKLTSHDEFLAIVSHDLRNPIGTVLSYTKLLLEENSQTDAEAKKWAEVIKRNAETALRLINDILDMERFAEGKLQLNMELHNINSLIQDSAESFLHSAADKDITLHVLPSEKDHPICCDRDRVAQVLANLLSNAIKFTPKGGSITVHSKSVVNEFVVSVTDTGVGVPEDQKQRIFERYAQIGNKDRQGLGLGLYISTMLIEAHKGKIAVVSKPGKGSTFCFSLPMNVN